MEADKSKQKTNDLQRIHLVSKENNTWYVKTPWKRYFV